MSSLEGKKCLQISLRDNDNDGDDVDKNDNDDDDDDDKTDGVLSFYRSAKDVEELFGGRIEAPNKTHILDNIFKGYDSRVRPYYRGKQADSKGLFQNDL